MAGNPHLSVGRSSPSSTSEFWSFILCRGRSQPGCCRNAEPGLDLSWNEYLGGRWGWGAGLLFDPPQSLALILFLTQLGFVSKVQCLLFSSKSCEPLHTEVKERWQISPSQLDMCCRNLLVSLLLLLEISPTVPMNAYVTSDLKRSHSRRAPAPPWRISTHWAPTGPLPGAASGPYPAYQRGMVARKPTLPRTPQAATMPLS